VSEKKNLYEIIGSKAWELKLQFPEIPKYVTDNLKYSFYEWQKKAFENFLTYQEIKKIESPNDPTHLMFNMATGTGKTLLMAATILYYYKQGYNHFLFFVNQNNIVDKTENNFINVNHNKYLFNKRIVIDDSDVIIKKVETFSEGTKDIEIKFTTVQKLYNDIHTEKENQVLLDDLIKKDIVMLADEAHHLNTNTQKQETQLELDLATELTSRTSDVEVERKGWEHTVIELILRKKSKKIQNKNVLLEFTATIPDNLQVSEKYSNKIIHKFGLKEFLSAGYTKEINLISSTFNKKERILQALLFSWYREKIALKYYSLGNDSLANFKPVILFRSKSIDDSRSDFEEFQDIINKLNPNDFEFLKDIDSKVNENGTVYEQGKSRTRDVIEFIKKENISFSQIVENLKYKFAQKNCIITNSKDNTTKTEKTDDHQDRLLNSLEDKNNHIRAIFTVERLTEGWDVLNLFDIVRLYQGQNTGGSTKKTPEATTKEKQLIGRGVRYYPFNYGNKQNNCRKFDEDMKNELRVLEELYYYTYDEESRYISHLKEELRKDGYIKDNKIIKTFKIKKEFQDKDFYKDVKIWHNNQIDNPDRKKKTLTDISKDFYKGYRIKTISLNEEQFGFEDEEDINRLKVADNNYQTMNVKFKEFERHIIRKAINIKAKPSTSLFHFDRMKRELEIDSVDDLVSDNFLGDFDIPIIVNGEVKFQDISNKDKLDALLSFLEAFLIEFKKVINPKKGTEFIASSFSELFGEPKVKSIEKDEDSMRIESNLKNEDWYVLDSFHGTDQEKELLEEIKNTIANLQSKYDEVYLLRNEEVYKIYDFDKGRGFQPDFLLFLKSKDTIDKYYQIFIEPKGEYLLERDSWKNDFLKEITSKYGNEGKDILTLDSRSYKLIGLPLFNTNENEFKEEYKKIWNG
jgi:type III restriction enzyme